MTQQSSIDTGWGAHDDARERTRLVGSAQVWLERCRGAIRSPDTFDGLWESLEEGEPVFEALQNQSNVDWFRAEKSDGEPGEPLPPPEYAEYREAGLIEPSPLLASATIMLELAEALAGRRDVDDALSRALRHYDYCGVHSVGDYHLGSGTSLTSGDGPLPGMVSKLIGSGTHPSRGFVLMLLGALAESLPQQAQHSEVPVVFVATTMKSKPFGDTGQLRLRLLEDGPSGIHPDSTMAFLLADEKLNAGIDAAWAAGGMASTGACVVWSVIDKDGNPCTSLEGDSMAAAFAVALDDLAPSSRWRRVNRLHVGWLTRLQLHRLWRRRSLDPNSVVTAGLSGSTLTRVDGYREKMSVAADRQWRVVVAKSSLEEAQRAAPDGVVVKIVPAENISEAIEQTRTERNPYRIALVLVVLAVIALAVPVGYYAYATNRDSRNAELATELASKSRDMANRDSRLAALLAVAGDRIDSTETTRTAMRTVADNNKSVVASAKAGKSPIVGVASYGNLVLTNASGERMLKAWSLSDMAPLGEIPTEGSVRGIAGAGYSMTGMFAVLEGSKLKIYQGIDHSVPSVAASFDTGFDDANANVFGPFIDAGSNAVVAFDENYHGVFWTPGMKEPDHFSLKANSANSKTDTDFGNETVVAVSGFGYPSYFTPSDQQTHDTDGHTVTIAGSDNSLRQLKIESRPGAAAGADAGRIYSTDRSISDVGSPIHSVLLTPSGTIRVGTNAGLKDYSVSGDDVEVEGLIREQVTDMVYLGSFSDTFAAVTSRALSYIDSGRVQQTLTNTTTDTAVDRSVRSIANTFGGTVISGRADGSVFVHDPENTLTRLKPRFGATDVKFAPDGHLIMAGVAGKGSNSFGALEVDEVSPELEAASKTPNVYGFTPTVDESDDHSYSLDETPAQVFSVDATRDYAVAAGYSRKDQTARVWLWHRSDDDDDADYRALSFPNERPYGVPDFAETAELSPDGSRVYGMSPSRKQVVAWDTATGEVIWSRDFGVDDNEDATFAVEMTADADRQVAVLSHWPKGSDHRVHSVIDLENGEMKDIAEFGGFETSDVSPDGKKVAMVRENELAIYSIDGEKLAGPANLGSTIGAVAWSADGDRLAVDIQGTGQIAFRSADDLGEVAPIWHVTGLGDTDQVTGLAWSPDGRYLAANTATRQRENYVSSKNVEILLTKNLDLTAAMCGIANSDLTAEEWKQYVGSSIDQFPLCPEEG